MLLLNHTTVEVSLGERKMDYIEKMLVSGWVDAVMELASPDFSPVSDRSALLELGKLVEEAGTRNP